MLKMSTILEGLIVTHPISTSIEIITNWNKFDGIFHPSKDNRKIIFSSNNISSIELDKLLVLINNLGWYPSRYYEGYILNDQQIFNREKYLTLIENTKSIVNLIFEAKYDVQLDELNIPNILYHIAPLKYKPKILKIGLVPKSKEKIGKHKDRIYLSLNMDGIHQLVNSDKFYPNETEFVVYSVDMKKYLIRQSIKVFEDPMFLGFAVYIYENIPPQYLIIAGELNR